MENKLEMTMWLLWLEEKKCPIEKVNKILIQLWI